MLISFVGSSVLLHLTETHLTGLFSVCQMEEIFLKNPYLLPKIAANLNAFKNI